MYDLGTALMPTGAYRIKTDMKKWQIAETLWHNNK